MDLQGITKYYQKNGKFGKDKFLKMRNSELEMCICIQKTCEPKFSDYLLIPYNPL